EFLDPLTAPYYEDLITWGSIGARTSSSQPHRQLASGLEMPVGIKNGITGNIPEVVNSLVSVSQPHVYVGLNESHQMVTKQSLGNGYAHLVLRGGERGPNYDPFSVMKALKKLKQSQLMPRLVIDCSHQNSLKQAEQQIAIFESVLGQILAGNSKIRGVML